MTFPSEADHGIILDRIHCGMLNPYGDDAMNLAILVAVTSLHIQGGEINPHHLNQFNPGIAIQVDQISVGAYQNSNKGLSTFAAYSPFKGWCQPFVAVVTGYKIPVGAGVAIVPWKVSGPVFTLTPMNANGGFVLGAAWRQSL
jgi:hypothetical protein